jgi:hypothetical protein
VSSCGHDAVSLSCALLKGYESAGQRVAVLNLDMHSLKLLNS